MIKSVVYIIGHARIPFPNNYNVCILTQNNTENINNQTILHITSIAIVGQT
jgi:hypothetical protein